MKEIKTIKLKDISIQNRQRQEFTNLDKLALSLQSLGQQVPIIVRAIEGNEEYKYFLVDGERRIRALKKLGNEEVLALVGHEDIDIAKHREMEFAINVEREDFTWQERARATEEIHKANQEIYGPAVRGHGGGWGQTDTADKLKTSTTAVNQDIKLSKAMEKYPELGKAKSRDQALKHLLDIEKNAITRELAKRRAKEAKIEGFFNEEGVGGMKERLADGSIDLILTDPPYGVEFTATDSDMWSSDSSYNDDAHNAMDLLANAAREMYCVLADNRHALIFFGIQHHAEIVKIFTEAHFNVSLIPIIWSKMSGSSSPPPYTFNRSYECILHCMKGKRELFERVIDIQPFKRVPPSQKIHPSEKPQQLLQKLVEACSTPGEHILDPFAGSGSTLRAALSLNRTVTGFEISESLYASAATALHEMDERRLKGELLDASASTTSSPTKRVKKEKESRTAGELH